MLPAGAPLSVWLTWLETLSPTEINLGIARVRLLLDRLQLPLPVKILLIAGTNGKGSCVAMTDALLRAAGLSVGAYTSPHISRYNERIVVNGEAVDDCVIINAFEVVEAVRGSTELTYFEYGTLAALIVFAEAELDVWVLEVGLGGRLDATNAIDPTAVLITNVSLDHCAWLGNDVETIALEKAGIMRAGIPVTYGGNNVPEAIQRHSSELGADLSVAGRDFRVDIGTDGIWSWHGPSGDLESLKEPGLLGEFQIHNAAAVLAMLDTASLLDGIDADLVNRVLPSLSLAGRSQRLTVDGVEWFFDVAHNPAAASALATTLASCEARNTTFAIVGLLDDKDVDGVIAPLTDSVDHWIAVLPNSERAMSSGELARQISNLTARACLVADSVADAVKFARHEALESDRILVTGSFFTVGPILDQLATESRPEI